MIRPLIAVWISFVLFMIGLFTEAYAQVPTTPSVQIGVAKVDITPSEPVRLSGYAARKSSMLGVDDPLAVRAVAMRAADGSWSILASIDTIGLSAELTDQIHATLRSTYGLERKQVVLCCTHSHTTPHLDGVLVNLFGEALSPSEKEAITRYSQRLVEAVIEAIGNAIKNVQPGTLEVGEGVCEVAKNRRPKLADGMEGPVDRNVRVIRVLDDKHATKAVLYQYACHCTTLPPELNRVSGDWAGISASLIEKSIPGCVALPVIGCGADANPQRRGDYAIATQHGASLADAITKVLQGTMKPLPPVDRMAFEYVALAYERPSRKQLEEMLQSQRYQEKVFAGSMLDTWKRKGRLPETYPAPMHVWKFGTELCWVFMGGEVVVDYQMRLAKDLADAAHRVWVAGYTDDVFAYVASERVRKEGGYEVDQSMLYYNRPGRWESGTEDFLVGRIQELSRQKRDIGQPLDPQSSLKAMEVAKGYRIELIASEPVVQDPINLAFDLRGRPWIVEMTDYPRGEKQSRGRVKILEDRDRDGHYESSKIFLDQLEFPTGVFPWKDGAIITCAPDVFWARDTNGDDIADEKIVIATGFAAANPQHRVHGFTYGLDHRLYFGTGDGTKSITLPHYGSTLPVAGSDLSLDVEAKDVQLHTGKTQFIRGQDDWGNWFGNDNVHPIFHYAVDSIPKDLPRKLEGDRVQHLLQPATAPPIFPSIRDADRFNDLHTANRFTSSCSSILLRSPLLGEEMLGAAIICEPVHNLVSRFRLLADGPSFRGARFAQDAQSEWIRSSDPWFRPVRVENGPDGSLWILDMYRRVIEHPEWIPDDWQARIDIRSGEGLGRIYRVTPLANDASQPWSSSFQDQSVKAWIERLKSPHGGTRDLAQRALIFFADETAKEPLRNLQSKAELAATRLQSFSVLRVRGWLTPNDWERALLDPDPRVSRMIVRWGRMDQKIADSQIVAMVKRAEVRSDPIMALELLLQLASSSSKPSASSKASAEAMAWLLGTYGYDDWFQRVAGMVDEEQMDAILASLMNPSLTHLSGPNMDRVLVALVSKASSRYRTEILNSLKSTSQRPDWHFVLAAGLRRTHSQELDPQVYGSIVKDARRVLDTDGAVASMQLVALQFLVQQPVDELTQDQGRMLQVLRKEMQQEGVLVALEGLKRLNDPSIAEQFLLDWDAYSPSMQSILGNAIVTNKSWFPALVRSLERNALPMSKLDPRVLEQMQTTTDEELRQRCQKLIAAQGKPQGEEIQSFLSQMPAEGNPEKGQVLFQRHCQICHSEAAQKVSVGPSLAGFRKWSDTMWVTAILEPNRAVEVRYRRWTLLTEEDEVIVGLLKNESNEDVTIVSPEGKHTTVAKQQIQKLEESDRSLMPEGFGRYFSPQDMRNLLSFLQRMGGGLNEVSQ